MTSWNERAVGSKSLLHRVPAVYEGLQALRDLRIHRQGVSKGSFAQHGEDIRLIELLRDLHATGPYVDVGSNHPFRLSNTYLLYRSGWRGVCVDPLARFEKLYRRWRPRDRFVCAAVGERPGHVDLHQFEWDPLSTLDDSLADQYMERGFRRLRRVPVDVKTIDQVLAESGVAAPISLLSIDIEGHEVPALKSMDLARWQPAVICIEAVTASGGRNQEALQYLQDHGYEIRGDLGLNVIFVRKPQH